LGKGDEEKKEREKREEEGKEKKRRREERKVWVYGKEWLLENAAFEHLSCWEECGRCWD
jgi:hypothetical protein